MKRNLVVTLTLGASLICMLAVGVEAQRGRRRGRTQTPAAEQVAPDSAGIAEALAEVRWGAEPAAVHELFSNRIRERYRERLTKAPGAIEEDRIRGEMNDQIRILRESYVRFDGTRTGWDASFLRTEFTQGNRESMLEYRDENSRNFYFFIGGRLWKWYKAFDASVFGGQGFDQFAAAVQGRFGPAVERTGRLVENGPEQHWLEWQDATTRLRAVDQTQFYGFYCLVFEDKSTLARLPELRRNTAAQQDQGHAVVESIVLPEGGDSSSNDSNANIIDRITGNDRSEPAAAGQQGQAQPGNSQGQGNARQGQSRGGTRNQPTPQPQGLDLSDL